MVLVSGGCPLSAAKPIAAGGDDGAGAERIGNRGDLRRGGTGVERQSARLLARHARKTRNASGTFPTRK